MDTPFFGFLMGMDPLELFRAGKGIMWPILLVSFIGVTVTIERIIFVVRESQRRDPDLVERMITQVESGNIEAAIQLGRQSNDYLARIMVSSLAEHQGGFSEAFLRASSRELTRFSQGLPILDTVITAAPLLGLLGTVTGMMGTFGALGASDDIAAAAGNITGGVAEALIATMCGLAIAIMGLLPFNYLNARLEEARHEVEDVANALETVFNRTATETAKA
jgi:biopolymer transport protein ExbB